MTLSTTTSSHLCHLSKLPHATQREIANATGLGLATVNAACKECETAGLISDGRLTATGIASLKPYAVDNAIILAAGLSSRFAPIPQERPEEYCAFAAKC